MNGISRARVGAAVIAVTALALAGCGRDATCLLYTSPSPRD